MVIVIAGIRGQEGRVYVDVPNNTNLEYFSTLQNQAGSLYLLVSMDNVDYPYIRRENEIQTFIASAKKYGSIIDITEEYESLMVTVKRCKMSWYEYIM